MAVPEALLKALRERGLDIGDVVDILAGISNIDPPVAAAAHAELAARAFREALSLVERGDVVQSSEKLYKAAEEAVKALAIARGLNEAKEALSRGRWTVGLLDKAAQKLGDAAWRAWDAAYFLHVNGFHETRIDITHVKARIPLIEPLIREAEGLLHKP
ncbi:PaREP1 family protein [Pyrobaculum aerophilum]|uniref:PaREP1 family protein n=1 Tax=Pyrobaculum aerophilum TaxID=13773 RepID=UPI0023F52AA4|nr:PaREP1 family protein [Pyrobaculum aerophilum]MCX8136625.1 PaREP1 family protein [Pyrobaculum aerophilum]